MTRTKTPDHTADRYTARVRGREKSGHLLLLSWPVTTGRRGRPALCGASSTKWTPTRYFDAQIPPCPDCSAAAGIVPPTPTPLLPAQPAPRPGPPLQLTSPSVNAVVLDPQLERTALPDGWRRPRPALLDVLRDVETAGYVPAAQLEREAAYAANQGLIAFPDWCPLTPC